MQKTRGSQAERRWNGMALFSFGFRPFFFGAAIFALVAISLWLAWLEGAGVLPDHLGPVDWHVHELLFGYASAVVAGFLFTAVPNWTGRFPIAGWPLIGLFTLWLAGRLAMSLPLPGATAAVIDSAFLPVLALVIAREIMAGKNWRNLRVLMPVMLFAAANIGFHIEAGVTGSAPYATRAGFGALAFLLMLIGGRITPSFTRNWLAKQGPGRLPAQFGRFDGATIVTSVAALAFWSVMPTLLLSGLLLLLAGVMNLIRVFRWAGERVVRNPLLIVLHLFYGCVGLSFLFLAGAAILSGPAFQVVGLHVLGIGAIGGMTLSVMIRASLGHTGRTLAASPVLNAAFVSLILSLVFRIAGAYLPDAFVLLRLSGVFWLLAFGLFAARVGPWLWAPRLKKNS